MPKKVRLAFFLVLVVLGGCQGPHFDLDRHASPPTGQINPIHGGSTADEPHHDATVSIHYSSSSSIFCSGTLIAPDVVLTAAHCVSSGGSYRVYFGDNPVQDPSPRFVTVSEVQRHPEYSSAALTSDIALVRLAEAVNDIAPVPPLPESLGLTQADLGVLPVNFAGFGRTENGTFDQKLQVDGTVEALGCDVSGCSGTPTALEIATQFSYTQPAGGPCNGDSGGPAFVERGDDIYVAGITSYGGACSGGTGWGASTRVDAFESFIAEFVGDPVDPVDPVPTETVTLTEEGLSGEQTEELRFEFEIPEDATAIQFSIAGGAGDADLYVAVGSEVTTSSYDCRPYIDGNIESCAFSSVEGNPHHVMLRGYRTFSDVTLTVSYEVPVDVDPQTITLTEEGLSGDQTDELRFSYEIPAGASALSIAISGGTGDADLYVATGSEPTTTSYDCRPYLNGNIESCAFEAPEPGEYHIMLRGYRSFSGVTLTLTYDVQSAP